MHDGLIETSEFSCFIHSAEANVWPHMRYRGCARLIYSPPERVWLGSDNSGSTRRADTAPQRVIQAVITPSQKHARAGKREKKKDLSKCQTAFSGD